MHVAILRPHTLCSVSVCRFQLLLCWISVDVLLAFLFCSGEPFACPLYYFSSKRNNRYSCYNRNYEYTISGIGQAAETCVGALVGSGVDVAVGSVVSVGVGAVVGVAAGVAVGHC